ncbi:septal ring lytic transglycosylase RlpA family protein [Paraburkholderia dipogonis]|uniref:septal ring lytic transglycosylase RlpA family protein n=1 Tax=Paraburkholderia dipogonis TaxID=1211383 RepID=UPI001FCC37DA|nr:septal ring lytic transglycosylase RlpA family protein [Paraburkholderia dipogonis]
MENNRHTTQNRLPGNTDRVRLRRARESTLQALLFVASSCFLSTTFPAQPSASADTGSASATPAPRHLDRSGKSRRGKASYYGREFYKKEMADGTPMNPQSNAAASKTLPLGTKARVTNLKNGNSEVVEIRDRGPYVKNRIVDLSPKTADKLGLKKDGVVPVEVKPVEVPQADGTVKPGAGVQESERGKSPVDVQHSLH